MKKLGSYALLLMLGCCISCNKLVPSGFWKDFRKEVLRRNISDQGPYGGHRAMYWESNKTGTFTFDQIRRFSGENGWLFVDSTHFYALDLATWKYGTEQIFPLTSKGLDAKMLTIDATFAYFPRWISEDVELYRFKTNWVLVEPGTDNEHTAYGYVIINEEESKVSVYHFWGG